MIPFWKGTMPLSFICVMGNGPMNSKHKLEFMGPFPITQINDNGTVRFQKGIIKDAVNIRRIKPFFD